MADDIVSRLRQWSLVTFTKPSLHMLPSEFTEAADEIVRLRAEVKAERALADQLLVAMMGTTSGHVIPTDDEWDEMVKMRAAALDAWEARRG